MLISCSKSFTEYYDPATHTFNIGPAMPVNSVHGLCSALSPLTGLVYLAARREPGKVRAFTFNTTAETFEEIAYMEGYDVRYAACAVVPDTRQYGQDFFIFVGGGA